MPNLFLYKIVSSLSNNLVQHEYTVWLSKIFLFQANSVYLNSSNSANSVLYKCRFSLHTVKC